MNYSHYVLRKSRLHNSEDPSRSQAFENDVLSILSLPSDITLTDRSGKGPAYIKNGRLEVGCESENSEPFSTLVIDLNAPFPMNRYPYWIVNTQKKTYDVFICAILLSLKFHFPKTVQVTTDGDRESWKKAFSLYQYLFPNRELPHIKFKEGPTS